MRFCQWRFDGSDFRLLTENSKAEAIRGSIQRGAIS